MGVKKEIVENVKGSVKTVTGLAGTFIEKVPEELGNLIKLLEDRNTELRLRFDQLTLDGDIALSLTLFKKEEK